MWKHKMDLARRKRRKQCTSAEEYDISAHEDIKTSALFFLGNKGCAPLYAPYLGKLSVTEFSENMEENNRIISQCSVGFG